MSGQQRNNPVQVLDSALVVANLAKDTLQVASVPSPLKEAATVLITILETIRVGYDERHLASSNSVLPLGSQIQQGSMVEFWKYVIEPDQYYPNEYKCMFPASLDSARGHGQSLRSVSVSFLPRNPLMFSTDSKLNNILTRVRVACSRNRIDRHLNHRTDREEIEKLTSDMDLCWKEFMVCSISSS
jgi:hypothetical protein